MFILRWRLDAETDSDLRTVRRVGNARQQEMSATECQPTGGRLVADGGLGPDNVQSLAESFAAEWPDYDLDYSPESLERLDELVFEEFRDDEPSLEEPATERPPVDRAGAYLAEVFLQTLRSEWIDDDDGMVLWVDGADGGTDFDPKAVAGDCFRGEDSFAATYDALTGRYSVPRLDEIGSQLTFDIDELAPSLGQIPALQDEDQEPMELAVGAIDQWPSYDLDGSPESLRQLDTIVDEGLATDVLDAAKIGSYAGSVFATQYDGRWAYHDETGWVIVFGTDDDDETPILALQNVVHSCIPGSATFAEVHDSFLASTDTAGPQLADGSDSDGEGDSLSEAVSEEELAAYHDRATALADEWPDYELDLSPESLERLDELVETEFEYPQSDADPAGGGSVTVISSPRTDAVAGYFVAVVEERHDAEVRHRGGEDILVLEGPDGTASVKLIVFVSACFAGQGSFVDTYEALLAQTGLSIE